MVTKYFILVKMGEGWTAQPECYDSHMDALQSTRKYLGVYERRIIPVEVDDTPPVYAAVRDKNWINRCHKRPRRGRRRICMS